MYGENKQKKDIPFGFYCIGFMRQYTLAPRGPFWDCGYKKKVMKDQK